MKAKSIMMWKIGFLRQAFFWPEAMSGSNVQLGFSFMFISFFIISFAIFRVFILLPSLGYVRSKESRNRNRKRERERESCGHVWLFRFSILPLPQFSTLRLAKKFNRFPIRELRESPGHFLRDSPVLRAWVPQMLPQIRIRTRIILRAPFARWRVCLDPVMGNDCLSNPSHVNLF